MSAYAESGASFKHRCLEVGLSEAQFAALKDQNIANFNTLAFGVCGQPGQIDDGRFRNLLDSTFQDMTLGLEAMMRQLSYEAITISVAAIKQRIEPTIEGQLKKLPPHERDERMRKLSAKITGFAITGDYEPAHSVVDFFTTMIEESAPKYLPLSRCVSREQELLSQRVDKRIVVLEDQKLQVKNNAPELSADLSTDLKLQNAFIRRGIACEQSNLLTYETHEKIRHAFMAHMTRDPPPGFRGPDMSAILRADRELWMRAFDKCKSELKVDQRGRFPLDVALLELYTSPEVVFHLLPTPGAPVKKRSRSESEPKNKKTKASESKQDVKADDSNPNRRTTKKTQNQVMVPKSLKGFSGLNAKKMRICYNYNLPHGCSNSTHSKDGQTRCVKGVHQCIKCHKSHPLPECFQVLSVDHAFVKGTPIFRIDISKKSDRKILEDILSMDCILYVHFAPPCGTASAARMIRPGPPPLRSVRFPMGFKHSSGLNKERVRAANFLYKWTVDMILRLHAAGAAWSVENPAGSLMWITDPFVLLLQSIPDLIAFSFHTCMFSAPRKKDTAIWASFEQLRAHLERKCDGNHEHLPWGLADSANGFATAAECAYNEHMCASWAQAVTDYAATLGYVPPPQDFQSGPNCNNVHINKTILGCLPRGRKIPPLLTDWLEPQVFDISAHPQIQTLPVGKRIPDSVTIFPAGSKLVRFTNVNGGDFERPETDLPKFAMVGIPREPRDFIYLACTVVHPLKRAMQVGDAMLNAIDSYELGDKMEFRRIQCAFSQYLLRLSSDLRVCEEELHNAMPMHLQKVLRGKRITLFRKLLEECDYPDSKIAAELASGFPLCGMLPASGVFPPLLRPPDLHVDTLEKMCASFTARTVASTKPTNDAELDKMLWQATLDEAESGFLTGPFDVADCPKDAVVSPRFGLMQKTKLRPIDNFSASHVNSATGLQDKLQVDTIDEICAMIKAWAQRHGPGIELVGRSYDLRKAYRQIGIAEAHLKFAWISVWSPEDACAKLFRMDSMPFGATASVGAFLRLSQALKCLGIASAALVWSSFYDDFVCICPASAAVQVDRMVRLLFQVLGWKLSTDESKDQDFSKIFQALGVEFDLSELRNGFFTVGNTGTRKLELGAKIDAILEADCLSGTEATSLRSRLLFADAQVFGRFAKAALHEIGSVGLASQDMRPLTDAVRRSLTWMKERVVHSPPRKIDFLETETFYLFLDGACTDFSETLSWSGTSIGGVLVYPDGTIRECFGEMLPRELLKEWGRDDQQQYIFEAEVMPYAVGLILWRTILERKCIFVFIDNEGARAAWICGFASTKASQHMLHIGTSLEAQIESHPFFARVPTHSNIGDAPSRGKFNVIEKFGGRRARVPSSVLRGLMVHGGGRWVPFECEWG
eukprot:s19_g48.t1